jgi:arylsulfatase A-like enzyme
MTESRPNVLLITLDQWRADCLSAVGHPCLRTPNLDRLAAEGVLFRRHFTQASPCGPARASLLTGLYAHNHRSVRNGVPLDDRHTNIAREVRKAGYDPVLFG